MALNDTFQNPNVFASTGGTDLGTAGTTSPQAIVTPKDATSQVNGTIKPARTDINAGVQSQAVKNQQTQLANDQKAASELTAQQYADRSGVDVSRVQGSQGNFTIGPVATKTGPTVGDTAILTGTGTPITNLQDNGDTATYTVPSTLDSSGKGTGEHMGSSIVSTLSDGTRGIYIDGNWTPLPKTPPSTTTPSPGSPEDIQNQIDAKNTETDKTFQDFQDKYTQALNGTYPLTSSQQAQIDSIKQQYNDAKVLQKTANANYQGGVTNLGIARGLSQYAPDIAQGQIYAAVNAGIDKLSALDAKMNSIVDKLTTGFQKNDATMLKSAWDEYNKNQADQTAELQKQLDSAIKFKKDLAAQNLKDANTSVQTKIDDPSATIKDKMASLSQAMKDGTLDAASITKLKKQIDDQIKANRADALKALTSKQVSALDSNPTLGMTDNNGNTLGDSITKDVLSGMTTDQIKSDVTKMGADPSIVDKYDSIVNVKNLQASIQTKAPATTKGAKSSILHTDPVSGKTYRITSQDGKVVSSVEQKPTKKSAAGSTPLTANPF